MNLITSRLYYYICNYYNYKVCTGAVHMCFCVNTKYIYMEKEMATHSSILAWRKTEEPFGLQSMGSQRVRHDLRD